MVNPGALDGPDSNKTPALLIIVMSGKSLVDDRETEIFISKRKKKNNKCKLNGFMWNSLLEKKVTVNSKKSYKSSKCDIFYHILIEGIVICV